MKVINTGALPVQIHLPAISGTFALDPSEPSQREPIRAIDEWLGPGQISREYPEQHREILLGTQGLKDYTAAETAPVEPEPIEETRVLADEDVDVTPTKPKLKPQTPPKTPPKPKAKAKNWARAGRRKK